MTPTDDEARAKNFEALSLLAACLKLGYTVELYDVGVNAEPERRHVILSPAGTIITDDARRRAAGAIP